MTEYYTTRKLLKSANPHNYCFPVQYDVLLDHIGADYPMTKRIPMLTILESNGLSGVLWCFDNRIVLPKRKAKRLRYLFSADCAKRVLDEYERRFSGDDRVRKAVYGIYDYLQGKINEAKLKELSRAAAFASYDAVDAAYAAAGASAGAAAYAAYAAAGYAHADIAAASDAERAWQIAQLRQYLTGELTII